ncbi:MarR family transcriptional regulator [Streptosporangiaceae bacterium NEAU-GS5]|nr:MarR family transcriptional regulator [Streptosporangiaceae bacterium NEAU-GS5]
MDPFDDPRLTAVGLLAEVFSGIQDKLGPAFAEAGLSEVDFETLIRLARSPERRLRMTDLAGQTNLSTSGITRVVDRLERERLVERVPCLTDRRTWYARLTDEGAARLQRVIPQHLIDIETYFTGLLPEAELTRFLDTLRIIRDVVRPCATAGVDQLSDARVVQESR